MQIARPVGPPNQALHLVGPQPSVSASLNVPITVMSGSNTGSMVSPTGFHFLPSSINYPASGHAFAPGPPQFGSVPISTSASPLPLPSNVPSSMTEPTPASSQSPVPPPASLALSQSQQGCIPSLVTTPRPQRPNSGDFTFQPLRPQVPTSQTSPGSSNQPLAPHMPPRPASNPPAPQVPSFRPASHESSLQVGVPSFPSPWDRNQIRQPQAPVPFGVNPSQTQQPPPRLPSFSNPNPVLLTSPIPHQARQMSNSPGYLPLRPVNPLQLQQNQLGPTMRPGSLLVPNQQFSNSVTFLSGKQGSRSGGGNQVYDPFSPTSVPPHQAEDSAKNAGG